MKRIALLDPVLLSMEQAEQPEIAENREIFRVLVELSQGDSCEGNGV